MTALTGSLLTQRAGGAIVGGTVSGQYRAGYAETAIPGKAQAGGGPVHGCPAGDVCTYGSETTFGNNITLKTDFCMNQGFCMQIIEAELPAAVVNNTDAPQYSSEGNFVLEIGGLLCVYVPDSRDEQAPNTIENPADNQGIDAMAIGSSQAEVDSALIVDIGSCHTG